MNSTKNNKIISAAIDLSDINEDVTQLTQPLDNNEKKIITKRLLNLPANFNDSIDFNVKNDKVVFSWKVTKINSQADKVHKEALKYARTGDLNNSIAQWEEAAQIDPYNPEYFFNLGIAYFELKKYIESIDALTRTLSICPIYFKAHLILGTSYLKIRKFGNSKKQFEKYLKFDKTKTLVYLNLGTVNSILKEYKNGFSMFEKAIELSPNEPRAYFGLAKIKLTLGEVEKSNYYFKKVIEIDKNGALANYAKRSITSVQKISLEDNNVNVNYDNPEDYYSEGYRNYLIGDFKKAVQMYKKYLSLKPDDDYVWCALGESYLRSGDVKFAAESFKKAAKLSPNKGLYFKELAVSFYRLEDYEKVIAAASKAKELGKADSVIYSIWGKALFEKGNINEAIIMLDHALKSNKNNLLAKYFLADALAKNDDVMDAIGYLDEITNSKIATPLKKKSESLKQSLLERE